MRDLLGFVPFRIAAALFGALPEPWMRWLGERGGRLWCRWSGKRVLLAHHQRRIAGTEISDAEVDHRVAGMFSSYGRYWAETFWLRPRRHRAVCDRVERHRFDIIDRAKEEGNGIIFAIPHLGSWEVAGLVGDEIGVRCLAVAEHLSNQRITNWFVDIRNQLGIDIVLTSDPKRNSTLIRRLKSGGAIALLADRDVTGRGLWTEFFGEEAKMPSGPAALADLTGAALIPVGAYYRQGAGHRIVIHEPVRIPDLETREQRVAAGAALLAGRLEAIIREAPEQWHLFQPNWPSDPGYPT
ncbi:MAG: phosphatidylinositol mannoside acyltransferase [Acidimicrobiia bacterium]|nr:phosphatidylinositol mannoside acyltransferase [Acidimicrobiia bacterium]